MKKIILVLAVVFTTSTFASNETGKQLFSFENDCSAEVTCYYQGYSITRSIPCKGSAAAVRAIHAELAALVAKYGRADGIK